MPTTIDIENAKQIRESMDVYVSLDAIEYAADLTTRSASGYSVKLLETNMGEDYPMRLLADLQGDGFPLDGSCELYDENETSSYQNGKIGCRAKVGNNLGLAMSSSSMFNTIMFQGVTNCEYATFGGNQYYPDDDDNIIISVGDRTSATVVFVQDESFERVQIRRIVSGIFLSFDNETLLSVNLALRADLKPFDPSLPESEIEIRAYYPYDISKALSAIQDEKPITYRSGYDADLSDPRHFYLSETATWEKGVLTIKGVDSVHKLDGETCPIFIGNYVLWKAGITNQDVVWGYVRKLYTVLEDQIHMGGIMNPAYDYQDNGYIEAPPMMSMDSGGVPNKYVGSIIERQSHRDVIANLMNLLHLKLTKYDYEDDFWPVYVDAGIPKLTWSKPESKWDIYESDCGDVQDRLDKKVVKVNYKSGTIRHTGPTRVKIDGSGTAFKNSGVGFDFGDYTALSRYYYKDRNGTSYYFTGTPLARSITLPANWTADDDLVDPTYGSALYDSSADKNKLITANHIVSWNGYWSKWSNWSSGMRDYWDYLVSIGEIESNAESASLEVTGESFIVEEDTRPYSISGIGDETTLSRTSWIGEISIIKTQFGGRVKILPDLGMKQLLERSNETGSFTWKGDPRMQPRDVFTFHRLTGETYDCTVESIELKHEGGGTTAEITYRRGIV